MRCGREGRRLAASLLAACLGLLAAGAGPSLAQGGWPELLRDHRQRYPEARAQDLYKLVYQGLLLEQQPVDPAATERRVVRELAAAEPNAAEPLIEPVDPDGRLVRLHLRPYKARHGSASALARAVVQTGRRVRPDSYRFEAVLQELEQSDLGPDRMAAELRAFDNALQQRDYPPVLHSDDYRELYRPEYVVVLAELVPALGVGSTDPAAGPAAP